MTKPEMIEAYAKMFDMTKTDSKIEFDHFVDFVTEMVAKGETVKITDFMEIGVKVREARTGRVPATGESIEIPRSAYPYVKFGKGLKRAAQKTL